MIYLEENRKEAGQSDSKDEVDTKGNTRNRGLTRSAFARRRGGDRFESLPDTAS